ncbi:hypothetical protein EDD15DRAFT_2409831 [Pisolithus albus]|nr:hypothetical protein EDD15DRAFT_2409831 [Pisolithus albus]
MYGIQNMKLDKSVVQRRIDMMVAEVVTFVQNAHVGVNVDAVALPSEHDAVVVCTGVMWLQDLATLTFSRNHVRVWGQIWCGKYGFEREGESCPHVRYFEPHGVLVVDAHIPGRTVTHFMYRTRLQTAISPRSTQVSFRITYRIG